MSALTDTIRASLVGLKMPSALEGLDHTVQSLEKGEIGALEAIDHLLAEEFSLRENRRAAIDGMMEPEPVAQICIEAISKETFLILPHEEVLGSMRHRTADYDRWIGGMRKLNRMYGPLS